jgi:outer membrane receptor protein involved in Fe transport
MKLYKTVKRTGALSCIALLGFSATAFAEDERIEEVVVTGSFIKGTPIDSESPVTVLERDELVRQGSPSIVEIVRRLSASSGVDGESNQFQSNASEGVANVNIRGLGPQRTLVLLNGRRQVPVPQRLPGGRFVDVNAFPRMAISSVEVLKEGAAATYGSDAIAGVANFKTRKDFQGLQLSAGFQDIDASDGNSEFGAIWGTQVGDFDWVTSFGYETRSELSMRDRPFSTVPFATNPRGGYSSIGNPGVYFQPSDAGLNFGALPGLSAGGTKDPNCEALGGVDNSLFCRFRYTDFDNLIEEEERYQLFSELNGELANGVGVHLEVMYSKVDVPEWNTSPSYPPQALFGDVQFLPADHPGLVAMASQYSQFEKYTTAQTDTNGVAVAGTGEGALFYGRIAGVAGYRALNGDGREAKREYDTYRVSGAFDGEFDNGVGWDVALTYSRSESDLEGVDAQLGRTKLAFRGFGGNSCGASLDTSGNLVQGSAVAGQGGCLYYNPLSNAIQTSYAASTYGYVNPDYNAAVANSDEVMAYLDNKSNTHSESSLFVLDAVFQGDLFDGEAAWAAGYQYRQIAFETSLDDLINVAVNPCAFEGQTDCSAQTGRRSFLSGGREIDLDQDVHSLFFETAMDISEDIDLQLAVRYEDYGDATTFDPKLAGRYVINDKVTLRGSVQTTFRGPDLDATNESRVTALSYVGPTAAFKAIDYIGNKDVEPESAFTYNFGVIIKPIEDMTITIDYWNYDFDNPIITEDFNALVAAYSAGGAAKSAVQSQIFCQGGLNDGSCAASAIERIESQTINGPSIETSGIDLFADYQFEMAGGIAKVGLDLSHTLEYVQDAYFKGDVQVSGSYDAAGFLNVSRGARPLPDLKGRAFAEFNRDQHNILLYVNHIRRYFDERDNVSVDAQNTFDLHYQYAFMDEAARVTVSAINVTDEEPPLARVDLNYDGYTHNAFGRMIKVGIEYTFDAE